MTTKEIQQAQFQEQKAINKKLNILLIVFGLFIVLNLISLI